MLHTWTVFLVFKIILILCVYGWCIYVCAHACGNPHMHLLRPEIVIMTSSSVISILQFQRLPLTESGAPCFDYIICSVTLWLPVSTSQDWVYRHILPVGAGIWIQTLMIVQRVFSTLCVLPKPAPYIFYFVKQSCFTYQSLFSLPPHLPLPPTLPHPVPHPSQRGWVLS